jgi:hypothetical protein
MQSNFFMNSTALPVIRCFYGSQRQTEKESSYYRIRIFAQRDYVQDAKSGFDYQLLTAPLGLFIRELVQYMEDFGNRLRNYWLHYNAILHIVKRRQLNQNAARLK